MLFDSVPIIDVGPLVRAMGCEAMAEDPGVRDVVRQLDLACRYMGFFYVAEDTKNWERTSQRVVRTSMRLLITSRSLDRLRLHRGQRILSWVPISGLIL